MILLHYETGLYERGKYTNLIESCRDVTGRGSIVALCNLYELRSIPTGNPDRGAEVRNNIVLRFAVPSLYTVSLKHVACSLHEYGYLS